MVNENASHLWKKLFAVFSLDISISNEKKSLLFGCDRVKFDKSQTEKALVSKYMKFYRFISSWVED